MGAAAQFQARVTQLESHVARLEYELSQRAARVKELNADKAQLESRLRELEAKQASYNQNDAATQLKRAESRIRDLERELADKELAEKQAAPEGAAPEGQGNAPQPEGAQQFDDLRQIRGIGPSFERSLRSMGVTTFRQIADWSNEEVESIAKQLKTKADRIREQDWVGHAKRLAQGTG